MACFLEQLCLLHEQVCRSSCTVLPLLDVGTQDYLVALRFGRFIPGRYMAGRGPVPAWTL